MPAENDARQQALQSHAFREAGSVPAPPAEGRPDACPGAMENGTGKEAPPPETALVIRLRYAKRGPARFVSHRDTERLWRRVLRRCRLPLEVSEGFVPKEKIQMGYPLSVGLESDGEDLLCFFREPVLPDLVRRRAAACLPAGFDLVSACPYDSRESLFARVEALVYRVEGRAETVTVRVENGKSRNIRTVLTGELGMTAEESMLRPVTRCAVRYR